MSDRGSIIPTMRYHNAKAAIDFLGRAFGFEPHMVVAGDGDVIHHAQLLFRGSMIMLGTAGDNDFDKLQKPPTGPDAPVTQSAYVIVEDVDAHHDRAVAAGARVVSAPADQDYGGRLYVCRDPEGHLWSFGSYDPWAEVTG